MKGSLPSTKFELDLLEAGHQFVAGVDEVGRGCLAGPVVGAAVVLPPQVLRAVGPLAGVRDSKQLSAAARQSLYPQICRQAIAVAVGVASPQEIDRLGIAAATRLAMAQAIAQLSVRPDFLLIDYLRLPELPHPQRGIVDGDALCLSIAAASVVAKVSRDRLMEEAEEQYPGYFFAQHKGYGTAQHLAALRRFGPCPIHRLSFGPVKLCLEKDPA